MILSGGLNFNQDDSNHETYCVPGSEPQKKTCIAESVWTCSSVWTTAPVTAKLWGKKGITE